MSSEAQAVSDDLSLCVFPPPPELRFNVLVYLPVAMGTFSLVGSSLILLSIFRRGKANKQQRARSSTTVRRSAHIRQHHRGQTSAVYHRIMIAMSIYDIMYTLSSAMFGLLLLPDHDPFESDDRGRGTPFTCTLQGFFIQWGFGSFAYGAWLSVYYVLTIRYNVQEAFLVRYVEPVIHSSVFVFYFGTALTASILGLMNPTGFAACWISPYPRICAWVDSCPCIRGTHIRHAILWMILIPSCTSVAVILICLTLVAVTVLQQRRVMRAQDQRLSQDLDRHSSSIGATQVYSARPGNGEAKPQKSSQSTSEVASSAIATEGTAASSSHSSLERLTKEAIVQSVLSGCTFVNSVLWTNVIYSFFIKGTLTRIRHYWV
jgi:hypothetical protein